MGYTATRAAWSQRREQAEDACHKDWNAEHLQPLLGSEPHTQLILGRGEGGARHYLDGRSVHARTPLELLLAGGTWVKVRYESFWHQGEAPMVHLELGGPAGAEQLGYTPQVSFPLRPRAVLRWPAGEAAS